MQEKYQPSDTDIDKWFEELEAELEKEQPQQKSYSLFDKVLDDFHGNAPIIDESYSGKLPDITPKARIFITQNL